MGGGKLADLKKISVKLSQEKYELIMQISEKKNESLSETIRTLIDKGLQERVLEENTDLITHIVRQQLDAVLKPHVERLAALSSKTGIAASTAMFLNVQSFMDLVPIDKRKEPPIMYEKARKKAIEYMRTPLDEWKDK